MKLLCTLVACTVITSLHAAPVGTAFAYQGRLKDGGNVPSGSYDFRFTLHDAAGDGNQIGDALTNSAVVVSDGLFAVTLDFGVTAFPGAKRWLQIATRTNDSGVAFTTLAPRQPLAATPYAILAENVNGTLMSDSLSGVYQNMLTFSNPSNQFTGTFLGNGTGLLNVNASTFGGLDASRFWQLGGNSGTAPGTNFLGTTDNRALEFRVNNAQALRLEPTPYHGVVNVVAGGLNSVTSNVIAATNIGGYQNDISSGYSAIGGGLANKIAAAAGTIAGGSGNSISTNSDYGAIAGGNNNVIAANSSASTIAGGRGNYVGTDSFQCAIGGGGNNNVSTNARGSTIAGGEANNIGRSSSYGAIAGGLFNDIDKNSLWSAIGGGSDNNIATYAQGCTIAGGLINDIGTNSNVSTIGGGHDNNIAADSPGCIIAGGGSNDIGMNANHSAIGGGYDNDIGMHSNHSAIGGGSGNDIGVNSLYATIPGGELNFATNRAFAAGTRAKARHAGAFVWGDSTLEDLASGNANSVTMRASGGYRLFSNPDLTAGVRLASGGGSWTTISDQSAKENFEPVNPIAVLEKVATLPVSTWNYKSQSTGIRHIGPMAQDFKAAFCVGETDTGITTIDADGVALAAIQGVNQKLERALEEKDSKIAQLEERLKRLEALVARDR